MANSGRQQAGFTLIEIMVVVVIIATLSMMTVVAINQAFERRYSNEAEKLLVWLNQLSEFSAMQGAAYGIVIEADKKLNTPQRLRATVYYRNRWLAVSFPEPFVLQPGSKIDWLMDDIREEPLFYQQAALRTREEIQRGQEALGDDKEDVVEPPQAFLPDGYVEPEGEIRLSFDDYDRYFLLYWDDDSSAMVMEGKQR